MDIFKEASRLKMRFNSPRGYVSSEQLWDLTIPMLDDMAVEAEKEYKDSGKKSFVVKKSAKDKALKLKFDVILDVLTTKVEEAEAARDAADIKAHNEKILGIIAKKQEGELEEMSIADLKKQLK